MSLKEQILIEKSPHYPLLRISDLSHVYRTQDKVVSIAGIPPLLILIIGIVWIGCQIVRPEPLQQIPTLGYLFYKEQTKVASIIFLGVLARSELPGFRLVLETRQSNPRSDKSSTHRSQFRDLNNEITRLKNDFGGVVAKRFEISESASSMDRECLDEIVEMVENDEFDILMYWRVHRLTRAKMLDTMKFILFLYENGIILYFDDYGYIDWEDANDISWLLDQVRSAREWRDSIAEGRVNNSRTILEEDKWPYGPIGYGLWKDEDDYYYLEEEYIWVIKKIFELAETLQDERSIQNRLKPLIKDKGLDVPSEGQIGRVLQNDLFCGRVRERGSGDLVKIREDIRLIEPKQFDRIHEKWYGEGDDDNAQLQFGPWDFPAPIFDIIARFGVEYIVENIQAFRWCCPKCGSIDLNISTTMVDVWGIKLPKLYCKEEDCGYIGPPIRVHDFEKIDQTWPLICSSCSRVNRFDVRELDLAIPDEIGDEVDSLYLYKCNECGEFQILPKNPNTVIRALKKPNLSLTINRFVDSSGSTTENEPSETYSMKSIEKSRQSTFDTLPNK